jgi:hypothetical protein
MFTITKKVTCCKNKYTLHIHIYIYLYNKIVPRFPFSTSRHAITIKYRPDFANVIAVFNPNPDDAPVITTNLRNPIFNPPNTFGTSFSFGIYNFSGNSTCCNIACIDNDDDDDDNDDDNTAVVSVITMGSCCCDVLIVVLVDNIVLGANAFDMDSTEATIIIDNGIIIRCIII